MPENVNRYYKHVCRCLMIAVCIIWQISAGPGVSKASDLNHGVFITAYHRDGYRNTVHIERILSRTGALAPVFLWTTYFDPSADQPPYPVRVDPQRTPDIYSLNAMFNTVRAAGKPVSIALYTDPQDSSFRGRHRIDVQSYRNVIAAQLSKVEGSIDYIFLASELNETESGNNRAWEELISDLRGLFPAASILYAVDRSSPLLTTTTNLPEWLSRIDYLGVTLYHGGVSMEHIADQTRNTLNNLIRLNQLTRTKGFVGEVGYSSADTSMTEPWQTVRYCQYDEMLQLQLYQNMLPLIQEYELPFFLWRIEPIQWDGECDYTFINKPAEAFILSFAERVTQDSPSAAERVTQDSPSAMKIVYDTSLCYANCKENCHHYPTCLNNCQNVFKRSIAHLRIEGLIRLEITGDAEEKSGTCESFARITAVFTDNNGISREAFYELPCNSVGSYQIDLRFEEPVNGNLEVMAHTGDWCISVQSLMVKALLTE